MNLLLQVLFFATVFCNIAYEEPPKVLEEADYKNLLIVASLAVIVLLLQLIVACGLCMYYYYSKIANPDFESLDKYYEC